MTNEDLDLFVEYLKKTGLTDNTCNRHIRNYKRLPFNDNSTQDDILKSVINDETISIPQKLLRLSSGSKYLKYKNMKNDKILSNIMELNKQITKTYMERNKKRKYDYNKQDILNEMNRFYDTGNKKAYLLSYLVVTFNTRNKDCDVTIARHKKYCKDKNENYLVLRKNDVIFIRNFYKTCKAYGTKEHIIRNKKILECVNYLMRDKEFKTRKLFDNFYNCTKIIKRYMPYQLKTSDIVRIILNCNNSLKDAVKISKNRGTTLKILNNNYNLKA